MQDRTLDNLCYDTWANLLELSRLEGEKAEFVKKEWSEDLQFAIEKFRGLFDEG